MGFYEGVRSKRATFGGSAPPPPQSSLAMGLNKTLVHPCSLFPGLFGHAGHIQTITFYQLFLQLVIFTWYSDK